MMNVTMKQARDKFQSVIAPQLSPAQIVIANTAKWVMLGGIPHHIATLYGWNGLSQPHVVHFVRDSRGNIQERTGYVH